MSTRPVVTIPPGPDYALRITHRVRAGWEQWYWFQSDLHWDSPEWLRKVYHRHAKLAQKRNALFIDLGDMHDVISGRNDPRGTKGTHRPEHGKSAYLDAVVDSGVDE